MQSLNYLNESFQGKTVLVTGHTGFKGSWLCEWLLTLNAKIIGVGLPPQTNPSLFEQLGLANRLEHHILDIRDREKFRQLVIHVRPDFIFHLAAQAIVRESYLHPIETYQTNVMGTVHLLEALQALQEANQKTGRYTTAVLVTTDKVYENYSWIFGYREDDPLGGYDPYSSSKAATEIAIASFRRSFFNHEDRSRSLCVAIASARAGNVIGGGDWAVDRIVPDCIRSLIKNESIPVRNPQATRPWQHVLDPLSGYLILAQRLHRALTAKADDLPMLCSAFNFGPTLESNRTVSDLVEEILKYWPGRWHDHSDPAAPHEAQLLNLSTDKAFHLLGWKARWNFSKSVQATVEWYRTVEEHKSQSAPELTRKQIFQYLRPNS